MVYAFGIGSHHSGKSLGNVEPLSRIPIGSGPRAMIGVSSISPESTR